MREYNLQNQSFPLFIEGQFSKNRKSTRKRECQGLLKD